MTDKSIVQVLRDAADLIEPEGKWIQEDFARDDFGMPLPTGYAEGACCWCALGAVEHVNGEMGRLIETHRAFERLGIADVASWNDAPNRTQEEVVRRLREAAALAEEQAL